MALSEDRWERRQLRQKARRIANHGNRLANFGIALQRVERASEGDEGAFLAGQGWVRQVGEPVSQGGVIDTLTRSWSGPIAHENKATFYFGEAQWAPLSFGADRSVRRWVCVGSMGSGKTEVLARWVIRQAMQRRNCYGGVVAPTGNRLRIIYKKIRKLLRAEWIAEIRVSEGEIELINGVILQFRAAKEYSADYGSPIAGGDWTFAGVDEEQDIRDSAMDEVEVRGRAAFGGYYPVLSTCTLKETPEWRARQHKYEKQTDCVVQRMLIFDNPFVPLSYIEGLKRTLSKRAYQIRVLAELGAPERAEYPEWSDDLHLRRMPSASRGGVKDAARTVTGNRADRYVIGHDPGSIQDVSIIFRPVFLGSSSEPVWWAVGEVTTPGHRKDTHWRAVAAWLQDHGASPAQTIVYADPYTDTQDTSKPHLVVYKTAKLHGFQIRPASYSRRNPTKPGVVPKEGRIELMNSLLRNEQGTTRFYIDLDDRGIPVCPKLVSALRTSERDDRGRAEAANKDKHDQSHWPAAAGYAVWPSEHARLSAHPYQSAG